MRRTPRAAAFSLMEVVLAIGIVVFSIVAMLGAFPVGLKASAASVSETRASQIASQVFASLKNPPFNAVNISSDGQRSACTLDLTATAPQEIWAYAAYSSDRPLSISGAAPGQASYYVIKLSSQKLDSDSTGAMPARMVALTIYPRDPRLTGSKPAGTVQFCSVVRNF